VRLCTCVCACVCLVSVAHDDVGKVHDHAHPIAFVTLQPAGV